MLENTTKKKLVTGFNDLWPTSVMLGTFAVTDSMISQAMVGVPDPVLNELMDQMIRQYMVSVVGTDPDLYEITTEPYVRRTLQNSSISVPGELPFHQHAGAHFTGICYIVTSPGEGSLLLHDPRHCAARGYDERFHHLFNPIELEPQPGDAILFPSFLYHSVTPANNLRLVVPFDIFLNK